MVSIFVTPLSIERIQQSLTHDFQVTNPTATLKAPTAIRATAAQTTTTTDHNNARATDHVAVATTTAATATMAMAMASTHNTATTNPTTLSLLARPTVLTPLAHGLTAPTPAAKTAPWTASTQPTLSKTTYTADKMATADTRAQSRKTDNTTHSTSKVTAAVVLCSHRTARRSPSLSAEAAANPPLPRLRGAICPQPHARNRRRRRAG
jgi:hypothetical protein